MPDIIRRVCFSNAPYDRIKRVFFNRRLLLFVLGTLVVGIPFLLLVTIVAGGNVPLLLTAISLILPFVLWVASLVLISAVVAIPRFAVVAIGLTAAHLGLPRVAERIADWAKEYEGRDTSME